ncbi:MAG: hypothetical protein NZ703_09485, partial [Gemmataceae bacterium]|nr:hypothetical protein [Gemmataceae bacterium]
MCAPSVLAAVWAGLTRRDAMHYLAGMYVAGRLVANAEASQPPPVRSPGPPPTDAPRRSLPADHIVDLTHTLSPRFPIWPGNEPIVLKVKSQLQRDGFYANRWD